MRLVPPFSLTTIVQGFGANAVNYGPITGTIGHMGIDFAVPWGTPIPATVDAPIGAILSKNNPNLMAYRAVNQIYDDVDDMSYEIQSGHCSEMNCEVGQTYWGGQALVGNTGTVFVGGKEVTAEEKMRADHPGSHLHYQVRELKRVPVTVPLSQNKHYLNNGVGLLEFNGFHYYVPNWNNGYNGCVDPMQFFGIPFVFTKNLWFGKKDIDNIQLQMRLNVSPTDPNFGFKTLAAVIKYQKANGITPTGFVGPITRASLNK